MCTATRIQQSLSLGLTVILVFTTVPGGSTSMAGQAIGSTLPASTPPAPAYTGQGVAETAEELQALVAPIALYPDALVAQVLAAATFPDQVAVANYWLHQNQHLTGTSLIHQVDKQSWSSSVKALTEFPSVLDNLAKNLTWTSSLGEAYHNQPTEVMSAIQ